MHSCLEPPTQFKSPSLHPHVSYTYPPVQKFHAPVSLFQHEPSYLSQSTL